MFFDHLDKRNTMMKAVTHFDNFIKWTFLVVNSFMRKTRTQQNPNPNKSDGG
jgi:hypothetical protein